MKILKYIRKNENGNFLVIFAISIIVIFGAVAMVVDVGRLYHQKSILQNAMDAAALGGAQGLLKGESVASMMAMEIAYNNSFPINTGNIETTDNSIKVSKTVTVPLTFAKILGINDATVSASAKAEIGLLKSANGVKPLAIEKALIPDDTEADPIVTVLNCGPTSPGEHHGNCGYLNLDSKATFREEIQNGVTVAEGASYTEDDPGEADTDPGRKTGIVKQEFTALIEKDEDAHRYYCNVPATADNSCERVVIVMIINTWDGIHGASDPVQVVGFASYWIGGFVGKSLTGQFIDFVAPGEIGGTKGNVYGVKLVE